MSQARPGLLQDLPLGNEQEAGEDGRTAESVEDSRGSWCLEGI